MVLYILIVFFNNDIAEIPQSGVLNDLGIIFFECGRQRIRRYGEVNWVPLKKISASIR